MKIKKQLLVALLLLFTLNVIAQDDAITLKTGQNINCTILERLDSSLRIKLNGAIIEYGLRQVAFYKMDYTWYNSDGTKKESYYNIKLAAPTKYSEPESRKIYCELVASGRFFSPEVTITVDYGQKIDPWRNIYIDEVRDENGAVAKFNSVIDALNYMSGKGWELLDAYPITEGNSGKVLHFYMFKTLILRK